MKKGFLGFIFSFKMVIILLLVIQIFVLLIGFLWLGENSKYFFGSFTLLSLSLVIYIFNKPGNPAFKMSWMVMILALPVVGGFLYLFIQNDFVSKGLKRRLNQILYDTNGHFKKNNDVLDLLKKDDMNVYNLAKYVSNTRNYPIYQGSEATYFSLGEYKFAEMKKRLEQASKFIFMEYFIIDNGIMWDTILEILKRKASEGVEVRIMYDGMCSIALLPYNYPKTLALSKIKAKMFAPIIPALSTHQNNRDHRKILVIDGLYAFTGGVNIADEYINAKPRFGHFKDSAIMITGEAVNTFTLMFLQMWNIKKNGEDYKKYLVSKPLLSSTGFIMPFGEIPLDNDRVAEHIYIDLIYNAKKFVHIMTPYLILTNEMITALITAAKSGVDVCIIMPHIPDKWSAFVLAKSYYLELIKGHVKIYEYTPGFVHAKNFVADDKAVVGTINFDYRSLYLHYECAAFMYKNESVNDLEKDYQQTLNHCELITIDKYKKNKLFDRFAGKVLRLFAPLM
ncbi:MAG: cardiolipin synthase [Bacilli bacterium]